MVPASGQTPTHPATTPPSVDAHPADLRLVVTDMDGTLLDAAGRVPDAWWPVLAELKRNGVVVAVASGRQYATLAHLFAPDPDGVVFIAENGAHVVRDGQEQSATTLSRGFAEQMVGTVRALARSRDLGLVWCGHDTAYVERADSAFVAAASMYYERLDVVEDLTRVDGAPLQFAVYDFGGARDSVAQLAEASGPYRAVATSENWIDIMDPAVHKGVAVRALKERLGVTSDQVAVFGDYLNDLQMLDEADWSFAMANAHPDVIGRARFVAPSHREHGVVTTLAGILARHADPVPA